jgi:hypothetical protein
VGVPYLELTDRLTNQTRQGEHHARHAEPADRVRTGQLQLAGRSAVRQISTSGIYGYTQTQAQSIIDAVMELKRKGLIG